jgi:hypothetical protein
VEYFECRLRTSSNIQLNVEKLEITPYKIQTCCHRGCCLLTATSWLLAAGCWLLYWGENVKTVRKI